LIPAILEQFQQADGSVKIPEVLLPFFGRPIIGKEK
jgi:seryl-tRNA synthetase